MATSLDSATQQVQVYVSLHQPNNRSTIALFSLNILIYIQERLKLLHKLTQQINEEKSRSEPTLTSIIKCNDKLELEDKLSKVLIN